MQTFFYLIFLKIKMPSQQITDAQNLQNAVAYVKSVLWITWTGEDAVLSIYVQSAVAKIYEMTWIDLLCIWSVEKKFDGAWQKILFLPKYISELEKVQYNSNQWWTPERTDFEENSYLLKDDWQLVFKSWLPRWFWNILIEFKYSFTDFNNIPRSLADLKLALALLVGNIQSTQKSTWISSESVSWTSITFDKTTMTSNVQMLLDKFIIFAL